MIDLEKLIEAGVHFGHKKSRLHPKMNPYIWEVRNGIVLIDVSKTALLLEKSAEMLEALAAEGKSILWVGTKKSAFESIQTVAQKLEQPYVAERWIGGTLTNYDQVRKAITRYLHLQDVVAKTDAQQHTKKEISVLNKEIERLRRNVSGITSLQFPPAALVVVDGKKEATAIKEACYLGIPVIGLIDTNTDPLGIHTIIPTNDDSPSAIKLILDYLQERVARGIATYKATKPVAAPASNAPRSKKQPKEHAVQDIGQATILEEIAEIAPEVLSEELQGEEIAQEEIVAPKVKKTSIKNDDEKVISKKPGARKPQPGKVIK